MKQTILQMIAEHVEAVELFRSRYISKVEQIASVISDSLLAGGCVFLCGNGGSAADCQHIAGELIGRFRKERRYFLGVFDKRDVAKCCQSREGCQAKRGKNNSIYRHSRQRA